jgi:hypothetical protein
LIHTDKGVEQEEPVISGYVDSADTSEMWASICIAETCSSGGMDAWSAGSRTALLRSTDGGVTWERAGTVESGGFVVELLGAGRLIIGTWDAEGAPITLRTFPELGLLQPPQPQAWPMYVRGGEILWRSSEGGALFDSDGEVIVDFGPDASVSRVSPGFVDGEIGLVVLWAWESDGYHYYLTLLDSAGQPTTTYEYAAFMMVSPLGLEKGQAYGNAEFDVSRLPATASTSYLPAVFDLTTGTVNPLVDPFGAPDFTPGRNHVAGVMRWPFYRVASPDACLSLRAEPSASTPQVACAADRVLLRGVGATHAGETVEAGGVTWLHALTPVGLEGWADSAFLAR